MTAAREDVLSPDELRKRLHQTFKSKGMLDTLKVSRCLLRCITLFPFPTPEDPLQR